MIVIWFGSSIYYKLTSLFVCFRVPWFQYPIIYDIRSKPRKLSSPTGSKGMLTFELYTKAADIVHLFCG